MPRRIPDFPDSYAYWNTISSFGSTITTVGLIWFTFFLYSFFKNIHFNFFIFKIYNYIFLWYNLKYNKINIKK
jgi:hypothetical protein